MKTPLLILVFSLFCTLSYSSPANDDTKVIDSQVERIERIQQNRLIITPGANEKNARRRQLSPEEEKLNRQANWWTTTIQQLFSEKADSSIYLKALGGKLLSGSTTLAIMDKNSSGLRSKIARSDIHSGIIYSFGNGNSAIICFNESELPILISFGQALEK